MQGVAYREIHFDKWVIIGVSFGSDIDTSDRLNGPGVDALTVRPYVAGIGPRSS
jgi:hypothetical protein